MSFGNCHIVGRPVLSSEAARQNGDVLSGADVMYGAPDDIIYELEPMLDMENGGSCKTRGRDCLNRVNMEKSVLIRRV